jgi:PAS domain S-box-containing protein
MTALHRFMDWPLRAKMAALLVVASLLPLSIATWINIDEARSRLLANTEAVLAARGDQLVGRLDTFNSGYQRAVSRVAHLPDVMEYVRARPADFDRLKPRIRALLSVWPASDANIRGVALLDASGRVTIGTEDRLIGVNLAYRSFVRDALRGVAVTSDVYFADPAVGEVPTIAFLAPVLGSDRQVLAVAAFWVHASALWDVMKASNGLAGPGSFAVLFDHMGIRIAHTYSNKIMFHPGGPLAPATIDALVAEHRFGGQTRQLLDDVRAFPEQFDRALSPAPDRAVFRGFAPVNKKWNYGVARRFATVPWTVFYMFPEESLQAQIAQMTRQKALFAGAIMLLALGAGTLFAAIILRPIRSLSAAAQSIAGGDLTARVGVTRADELGRLGETFNTMAAQIQALAAALVQESEAKYRTLFETLIEGFCTIEMIFDGSGKPVDYRFLEINPAFEKQTGLHDAQGKLMRELAPDHEQHWFDIYGKVALTGEPVQFENEAKALGRHFDVCAYRVGGSQSRKVAILFNDVTERKNAEGKLQAQVERLHLLHQITRATGERQDLPSIFQVVIRTLEDQLTIDFGCICLYEPADNQLVVARVGLRSQALALELALTENARINVDENGLSRCVRGQLVYEPDVSEVRSPFPQQLASGGLRSLVTAPLLVESKVFGVLVAARRAAGSFSSGECEFLRQLSEQVALAAHQAQLYGALQVAYDDLRQTQQAVMQQERLSALGQMASGIAHDINNAISPVALYTDALLERETHLSEQGRGQLQTIQRAVEDVAATVARMREFYRQREQQMTLSQVQLNELVPQVVDLTRARWSDMPQQRGIVIEMRTQLAADLPVIMGVESEIREALTNLIFNAVDAMPQGGSLTLRTRAVDRGQVQIEVSDTGTGMDERARARCLEPFFTTKGERGTGLGLAMVYGMVQRHGAEIEIDSAVGKGTTMRLSFAAFTGLAASAQAPSDYALPKRLRILIVDDDPVLLKSLRDTLEADGHAIVTANGGQEGIDMFRAGLNSKQEFAVVITDLGMPYVDGRQVASAVKTVSPSTPVVMLTGWGQRLVAEGDMPAHVDLVLNKPPKLRDLRGALARCCGHLEPQ